MTSAEKLELELRRENLLKKSARLRDVIAACKIAARAATKHRRLAHIECNGLPHWNPALQAFENRLTEEQVEKIDNDMATARAAALEALKSILVPGLEYDFQNDPAYCMVRVRDKENRRAFSL
jgi:hypothetical protein